jgi:hypothetical protein
MAPRIDSVAERVPVRAPRIERAIVVIRGHKVLLDTDLAALYRVPVKRLNEQVKRNPDRFPPDFAFELTSEEYQALRSQNATLDAGRGKHRKYLPRAFTIRPTRNRQQARACSPAG